MFSQFAQNTDWYYIVGQIFRTHCNHTPSCFQTVIFDVCFQEPRESMLTPMSLHSLSQKKKKKNFNYQQWSHGPILSQANKSGLSISQNWFSGDVLQKDEMRLMQHRKAQRVCLSRANKERGTVSLTLFVVPQFLVRSFARFRAHTCKLPTFSACTKPNYNHKCTHTHIHTLPWELQVSITSKHLQCDEKFQLRGLLLGSTLIGWLCFPLGLLLKCLITVRRVLQYHAAAATKVGFLKFLYHRSLFIFQLCTLLHLPPGKHWEA